ncbi:MAG: Uma2 family endonuclease [Solirubrobacteraceae bacterium]
MTVAQRMTADEYLATEFDQRVELIGGEVVVNQPRLTHGLVNTELIFVLRTWTDASDGRGMVVAPIDVRLDDRNVYAPDILWYSAARAPATDGPWPYPVPDLAIEIRSPSTWRYDVGIKKSTYEREGLPELWLVDTEMRSVLVFRRSSKGAASFDVALELDGDARLESPLLPGFGVAVDGIFPAA